MRILVVTHRLPYPPDKGERIRSYRWLEALSGEHDVDLVTLTDGAVPEAYRRALERCVDHLWVETLSRGRLVWAAAGALATGKSITEAFFSSAHFSELLKAVTGGADYDMCLAICSSVAGTVLTHCRAGRFMVDLIDVDSEKWRLYAKRSRWPLGWLYRRECRKVTALESACASGSQAAFTVSGQESRLLERIAPGTNVVTIPNGVDNEYFKPACTGGDITHVAFVGQMDYYPNVDAVTWFAEHVWPALLFHRPDLRFVIVGRHPTRQVRRLKRHRNIEVTGTVDDVRPYLQSAIAIAPLRVARGVQNKILEAMACGRPVVASPAAHRGLNVTPQSELLVAENASEWIGAIRLLLDDPDLAERIGANGRNATVSRFSWHGIAEQMLRAVDEGVEDVDTVAERTIERIWSGEMINAEKIDAENH